VRARGLPASVDPAPETVIPLTQIGSEGGFLPAPVPLGQLLVAPAERADVIVDFTDLPVGAEIYLTNEGPDDRLAESNRRTTSTPPIPTPPQAVPIGSNRCSHSVRRVAGRHSRVACATKAGFGQRLTKPCSTDPIRCRAGVRQSVSQK